MGYRVNSKKGTQFRQWATQTLREHLLQGYTLNQHCFEQNAEALLEEPAGQSGGSLPSAEQAMHSLGQLKQQLLGRGEATELFAQLREDVSRCTKNGCSQDLARCAAFFTSAGRL